MCDKIICLGDLVGYGPHPNECISLVERTAGVILAGNHDYAAVRLTDTTYFNVYARLAIDYTRAALDPENEKKLAALPLDYIEENSYFVHAAPFEPVNWNYILTLYEAAKNFDCFKQKLCFIGHSHVPVVYSQDSAGVPSVFHESEIEFARDRRYIINVGSVGQPRDGNPRAAFGLFDTRTQTYHQLRVEYDLKTTQDAMRKAQLPMFLIERLQYGQ